MNMAASAASAAVVSSVTFSMSVFCEAAMLRTTFGNITAARGPVNNTSARDKVPAATYPPV